LRNSSAEWIALLDEADVPVMPMHDFQSVLEDPHLVATGFFRDVEHPTEGPIRTMAVPPSWSRSKTELRHLAPRLGEHSAEILREAGYGDAEIADLVRKGVTVRSVAP